MKSRLGLLLLLPLLGGCVSSMPNTFQMMAGLTEPEYYPVTRLEWAVPWKIDTDQEFWLYQPFLPVDCFLNGVVETATLPITAFYRTMSNPPEVPPILLVDPTNGAYEVECSAKMGFVLGSTNRLATIRIALTNGEIRIPGVPVTYEGNASTAFVITPDSIITPSLSNNKFKRRHGTPVELIVERPLDHVGTPWFGYPFELLCANPYGLGDKRFSVWLDPSITATSPAYSFYIEGLVFEQCPACLYDHWSWKRGSVGYLRFETKDVKGGIEVIPGVCGR